MPTLFARCEETGRPILASQVTTDAWMPCWFCGVRVRRRNVKGKVPHFITYKGEVHSHPVCSNYEKSGKILNTQNAVSIFQNAMAREKSISVGGGGGGSNPPIDEEKETYLKRLSDLVNYGLFLCSDFKLNSEDRLSDILINPEIATDYFANGPIVNLGFRALMVRPETFNDEKMWIRYVMDYQAQDGTAKKMYFYQTTTADWIYNDLKYRIFAENKDGTDFVVRNYPAVLIYGAWVANECSWCRRKDKTPGCVNESGCEGYRYESDITKEKYLYPISKKQMNT